MQSIGESAISITNRLKNQVKEGLAEIHVSDSALYTAENLQKMNGMKWLSRVSETIKEAKELIENPTIAVSE